MLKSIPVLLIAYLFLAGCQTTNWCECPAREVVTLDDSKWILIAIDGGPLEAGALAGRVPFIEFGVNGDGSMAGFGGCNRFSGSFQHSGSLLEFGPIAATRMACPDMQIEDRFFRALDSVDSVEQDDYTLTLRADGVEVLRFRAEK